MKIRKIFGEYRLRLQMFHRNIRLYLLAQFMLGIGMTFWGLLFNLYLQDLGWNKARIGVTLGIAAFANAIFSIPCGLIAAKMDHKKLLIISQVMFGVTLALSMLVEAPFTLQSLLFIGFSFSTLWQVIAGPIMMTYSTHLERTYIFSISFLTALVGGIAGNVMAGSLKDLALHFGLSSVLCYRIVILLGIGISFFAVIPTLMIEVSQDFKREQSRMDFRKFREWNWKHFGKALLPSMLISVGAGIIIQFLNLYIKDTFKASDSTIGVLMSLQSLAMSVGVLLAPWLAEKIGKVNTIVWTELFSLPFMAILAYTDRIELGVLAILMRATLMNMGGPVSGALILEQCPLTQQPILNSLLNLARSLSWGGSAIVFGKVLNGNYRVSFLIAIVLYAISAGLYYVFFRDVDKPQSVKNGLPAHPQDN